MKLLWELSNSNDCGPIHLRLLSDYISIKHLPHAASPLLAMHRRGRREGRDVIAAVQILVSTVSNTQSVGGHEPEDALGVISY